MHNTVIIFFFISAFATVGFAQERSLVPEGVFLGDSLGAGEHILYSLKYTYPRETNLIFPDSTYDFFPFEYVSKRFFPTRADSALLTDSVIYTLTTFEIDPVLYLSIPVFILQNGDSTKYFSNIDSMLFRSLVDSIPANPEMHSNTSYVKVSRDFNYIYFLIAVIVLLLITGFTALFFGSRILSWIRMKRLEKAAKRFREKHEALVQELSGPGDKAGMEAILTHWKNYMEKLEKRPFTKLTTKELAFIYNDLELNKSLKEIDKALYGGFVPQKSDALFAELLKFSDARLSLKIEELKNG